MGCLRCPALYERTITPHTLRKCSAHMVSAGSVSNPILLHLCYSAQSVALMLSGGILLLRSSLIILAEGPVQSRLEVDLPSAAGFYLCYCALPASGYCWRSKLTIVPLLHPQSVRKGQIILAITLAPLPTQSVKESLKGLLVSCTDYSAMKVAH